MSYHLDPSKRWRDNGTVMTVGRGQEFVTNPRDQDSAVSWISGLLTETIE